MKSDTLILDVQGFKDLYNNFIIKELAFATQNYTQSFLIKPPYLFRHLTSEEKIQVKWIEKNRGIYWSEGHIDYREFHRMIVPYLKDKNIIVKGSEKVKWVKDLCMNCNVSELDEKLCPNLSKLHKKYSCDGKLNLCCNKHSKQCALKNVLCIKKYLEE